MTNATSTMESESSLDGRRLRGQRTRLKVIESLLELVTQGNIRPTAQEIAQQAGVALRTVYHHFEDVEALRRLALDLEMERHVEILEPIDTRLAVQERIEILARQCRELFEAVTPIRRAVLFDQHSSAEMAAGVAACTEARAKHVIATFAPELRALGDEAGSLEDAIVQSSSWGAWEYIRTMLKRPPAAAERVLVASLSALLTSHTGAAQGNGQSAHS